MKDKTVDKENNFLRIRVTVNEITYTIQWSETCMPIFLIWFLNFFHAAGYPHHQKSKHLFTKHMYHWGFLRRPTYMWIFWLFYKLSLYCTIFDTHTNQTYAYLFLFLCKPNPYVSTFTLMQTRSTCTSFNSHTSWTSVPIYCLSKWLKLVINYLKRLIYCKPNLFWVNTVTSNN